MMLKIIGAALIAAPFVTGLAYAVKDVGWLETLKDVGLTSITVLTISVGVCLFNV